MSFLSFIIDKLKSTIDPSQHNGAEEAVGGIASGAGSVDFSMAEAHPVTAEIAQMGRAVASNVQTMNVESSYLTGGAGGISRGRCIAS